MLKPSYIMHHVPRPATSMSTPTPGKRLACWIDENGCDMYRYSAHAFETLVGCLPLPVSLRYTIQYDLTVLSDRFPFNDMRTPLTTPIVISVASTIAVLSLFPFTGLSSPVNDSCNLNRSAVGFCEQECRSIRFLALMSVLSGFCPQLYDTL
ncbi:hypothetical protein VKT23_011906 [Stygiomarasmius scandens]|uniref:Uncharacterized protein n=1 Tax=Marasmiellus scandens TaxID=2682957 RepID=A0ABR1JCB8_9AGAR